MTEESKYSLSRAERAVFGLRALYESYGFKRFKVNKFEEYDFYVGCKSFLTSENVLTFTDSTGRLMALKPDVTLSVVKNAFLPEGEVDKVYYSESVYRDRGDGNGFREITQTGLECVGNVDLTTVCETASVAAKSLGVISSGRQTVLTVSHMGIVSGILDSAGAGPAVREEIRACLENKNADGIRRTAEKVGMAKDFTDRLVALCSVWGTPEEAGDALAAVCRGIPVCEKAAAELLTVFSSVGAEERAIMKLDFSAAGDMDYYTGIVFLGYVDGIPKCVLSGGRYDGLLRGMGRAQGGVGFAVFTDLLEEYPVIDGDPDADGDVFILYNAEDDPKDALATADRLRKEGKTVRIGEKVPEGKNYGVIIGIGGESK